MDNIKFKMAIEKQKMDHEKEKKLKIDNWKCKKGQWIMNYG